MLSWRNDAGSIYPAWRLAFFPTFALLGVALPVVFLASIEQYLYYLRPVELLPTYGTAWLLLAAPAVPLSLVLWLALRALRQSHAKGIRASLALALMGVAAAAIVGALAYSVLVWVHTFGLLAGLHLSNELAALSLGAGALVAITPAGRAALMKLYSVTQYVAALGALSLLSLPLCSWTSDAATRSSDDPPSTATLRSKPHILLVTIDALSAEHMSLYGARRRTTPSLDALAREATTFDRAYANGNFTTPGVSSILTATRPWTHRALQLVSWPIPEVHGSSLPAVLRRAGYQTGYVATNPWAGAARNGFGSYFNFGSSDRVPGFSVCHDGLATVLRYHCAASRLPPFLLAETLWERTRETLTRESPNRHFDPRVAMRPALEWLVGADKRTPIFLWVHFLPPHSPYAAPEPWLGQFDSSQTVRSAADSDTENEFLFGRVPRERASVLEARYDESVKYVDYYVGEYLERALQLLGPSTAVIVTADHGESFAHGYGSHGGPGLFESLIHIPLLVKLPYQTRGAHTSALAEQVDIAPTLAELAGTTPPSSWEGSSLLGLLRPSEAEAQVPAKAAFAMNFEENPRRSALTTGSVAVIDGRWKLVHVMGALHSPLMPPLHDQLYDLAADPGELKNRIADEPAEAERLRNLVFSELARHSAALP